MQTESRQLTLAVGGDEPTAASFRVSGKLVVDAELRKGADVIVSIVDEDGAIVAHGHGYVESVSFKEHRPDDAPWWTERCHGVKLQ